MTKVDLCQDCGEPDDEGLIRYVGRRLCLICYVAEKEWQDERPREVGR